MANEVIERAFFLGASVENFRASGGRNEEISRLEINVVEDPVNGDAFTRPLAGTPAYFSYGGFRFGGIVQYWRDYRGVDGLPVYSVTVYDPRIILSACQVIIGDYGGPQLDVDNLFDVYGYYERQFYGLADRNDAGMPWRNTLGAGVEPALSLLIASRKIKFRGYSYTLNWSEIQQLAIPSFYRIGEGGTSLSILELISTICRDANVDFVVNLEQGNVITIRLIRLASLQTGKIQAFINSKSGFVENYEVGKELIDPNAPGGITAGVLFGGPREDINVLISIYPFWGLNPFAGGAGRPSEAIIPSVGTGYNDNDVINVYGGPIRDIIGQDAYPLTIIELRCALAGQSTWSTYLQAFQPAKLEYISGNLKGDFDLEHISEWFNHPGMMLNETKEHINLKNERFIEIQGAYERQKRVYEFVKGIATDYWGKQYVVLIPFAIQRVESETAIVGYSFEPTESGWSEGAPMGLSANEADIFQDDYGKYVAFADFGPVDISTMDMTSLYNSEATVSNGRLFVKCEVNPQVFTFNSQPACLIKLSTPLYRPPRSDAGNLDDIAALFQVNREDVDELYSKQGMLSPLPLIHPHAIGPVQVAVPLRNNTTTYGPWIYGTNRGGGVRVEQNASLVPWNYGGSFALDDAGVSLWFGDFQGQQEKETGEVSVAGIPEKTIGDELISGGPTVDGISISFGTDGLVTTYSMETYVPRIGRFEQYRARRLQVLGAAAARQRRELQQIRRRTMLIDNSKIANLLPRNRLNDVIGKCGSSLLMATQLGDENRKIINAGVVKNQEALPQLASFDDETYRTTAVMSMDGMFRPFSTNASNWENEIISTFEEPIGGTLTSTFLNPFKNGHNISQVAMGETYEGISPLKTEYSSDVRAISLRGPLVITGWGYDVRGKPVPNTSEETPTNDFREQHLLTSDWWKSGPVDIKWDHIRKVWATSVLLDGTAKTNIPAGSVNAPGSGLIRLRGDSTDSLIFNHFNGSIPINTYIQCGTFDDKLKVISADC